MRVTNYMSCHILVWQLFLNDDNAADDDDDDDDDDDVMIAMC